MYLFIYLLILHYIFLRHATTNPKIAAVLSFNLTSKIHAIYIMLFDAHLQSTV